MITKTYYIPNSLFLDLTIEAIANKVPCFIEREFIELDHSKVTIQFRAEDAVFVINEMAPLI